MNIFGLELSFGKPPEVKSASPLVIPITTGSMLDIALRGGRVTDQRSMILYRKNSALATAVDLIAGNFEQIQPVLKGPDGKLTTDHDVITLLNEPNGLQSWEQLAGEMSRHYLLTSDSYLSGLGNVKRPPIELYSVKPQVVSVTEDTRDSFPARYFVTKGAGRGTYARDEQRGVIRFVSKNLLKEIFHTMGFSSFDTNLNGDSLIQAIAQEINQKIQGLNHNLKLIENGGRLSLIVSFQDKDLITDDEHKQRKKRINEDLSGSDNAGGIAVTSGAETQIKEVGQKNKDMDYAKLDHMATLTIYLRYKIPLPLVTNDASTFNNLQTAIGLLYDQAVLPLADTLFGGLSKFLLPRYGLNPAEWEITYDPLSITALKDRMLDQLKKQRDMNLETINELRAGMGREPIDEGGDSLYQPANLVVVGDDLFIDDDDVPVPEPVVDDDLDDDLDD